MYTETDYENVIKEVQAEFPAFSVVSKQKSNFMKAINVALKIITFGKMKTFMTTFTTTIGPTMYVPETWLTRFPSDRIITVRHERVHLRQSKKYGNILFSLMYMFLPLPIFFAYFRMKFEQEAYEETLRAYYACYGMPALLSFHLRSNILEHFTSAEYFWMWPWKKSLNRWYDKAVVNIIANG